MDGTYCHIVTMSSIQEFRKGDQQNMLQRPPFDQECSGEKLANTERRHSKRLRDRMKQDKKASEDESLTSPKKGQSAGGRKYKCGVKGLSGRAAGRKSEQERKRVEGSHKRRSKRLRWSVLKESRIGSLDTSSDSSS